MSWSWLVKAVRWVLGNRKQIEAVARDARDLVDPEPSNPLPWSAVERQRRQSAEAVSKRGKP